MRGAYTKFLAKWPVSIEHNNQGIAEKEKFVLDNITYELELSIEEIGQQTYIDVDSAIDAQIKLALRLIESIHDARHVGFEHFNFLLDITALKVKDIAKYVGMDPAHISQYKRNKHLSSGVWQMFRVFLLDFLTNKKVTNQIFLSNFNRQDAAS